MSSARRLLIAGALLVGTLASARDGVPCVVKRITDGDTLVCTDERRIRLLLIDTPELRQRPFGRQARAALAQMAPKGTRLRVELDVERKDRYRRVLAYLYLPDGRMLNEELARQGYALPLTYPPNVKYVERILAAVKEARRARRGLWAVDAFACSPRDFRARRCPGQR